MSDLSITAARELERAYRVRREAAHKAAEEEGLLGPKDRTIDGRAPRKLLERAKQQSGARNVGELLIYALTKVALDDDFGARPPVCSRVSSASRQWRKRKEFSARMSQVHLQCRHGQAAASRRIARLRGCGAAPQFQEGRRRVGRGADRDQPSDPSARRLLRASPVSAQAPAAVIDRCGSPALSGDPRWTAIVCNRHFRHQGRSGQTFSARDHDECLCKPMAGAASAQVAEGASAGSARSDRHGQRPGPECRGCRCRHPLCAHAPASAA